MGGMEGIEGLRLVVMMITHLQVTPYTSYLVLIHFTFTQLLSFADHFYQHLNGQITGYCVPDIGHSAQQSCS